MRILYKKAEEGAPQKSLNLLKGLVSYQHAADQEPVSVISLHFLSKSKPSFCKDKRLPHADHYTVTKLNSAAMPNSYIIFNSREKIRES